MKNWDTQLSAESIASIDEAFLSSLTPKAAKALSAYRQTGVIDDEVLIHLAERLEDYLLLLFSVHEDYNEITDSLKKTASLIHFYQQITKPAIRDLKREQYYLGGENLEVDEQDELKSVMWLMKYVQADVLKSWVQRVWQEQKQPFIDWVIFKLPKKLDYQDLVKPSNITSRFDYQYTGMTLSPHVVEYHVHYCIDCHWKGNDSCSKGLWQKRDQAYKISPLGRKLTGCPLGQKISQMHVLRKKDRVLAALAMVMIDNPLCCVTGDRICNDCMVACIYQKFEPVDTPCVETDTLDKVLSLPYGAEIYLLLARWNPLSHSFYQFTKQKGHVAVVGLGPSGFAMSYYLLMLGYSVTAFDGLSIRKPDRVYQPIANFYQWADTLLENGPLGFGGVVEYGITARWDKRKIALIWILLHRFEQFQLFDNMRLGGAVTLSRLKSIGFSHTVLATGAGLPIAHPLQRYRGMWFANEFLMMLQTSGVMTKTLKTGLALPMVVVGGGLTAIDCATEALVYYIRWVSQVAHWYSQRGEELFQGLSERDLKLAREWLEDGEHIRKLRMSQQEDQVPAYLDKKGGVSILYRRLMTESPAYRTNPLEIEKALEQGVRYLELVQLASVNTKDGWVESLVCQVKEESRVLPCRTVFFATGSKPNIAYYYEHRDDLEVKDGFYRREGFQVVSKNYPGFVSMIGDLHPDYSGSVVGALASAKDSYQQVASNIQPKSIRQDLLLGTQIEFVDGYEEGDYIKVSIKTDLTLPIGGYVKFVIRHAGVIESVKGIIVSQDCVWVRKEEGDLQTLRNCIEGVLGPSGVRVVSNHCADQVYIISDKQGEVWANCVYQAVTKQGKKAYLVSEDIEILGCEQATLDIIDEHADVFYCLSAMNLSNHAKDIPCRQASCVIESPMMCFLKGICGQCIQWQVDEQGVPTKAVYACSWSMQPLNIVDVSHYQMQSEHSRLDGLYQRWKEGEVGV